MTLLCVPSGDSENLDHIFLYIKVFFGNLNLAHLITAVCGVCILSNENKCVSRIHEINKLNRYNLY